MVEEVSIPVIGLLGVVISILSAMFAMTWKNMRCIAKMDVRIGHIEKWIVNHRGESAEARKRLEEAEKDIIRLQRDSD